MLKFVLYCALSLPKKRLVKLKTAISPQLKPGDTRLLSKFAWLPIQINGSIIWLESYQILQGYISYQYTVTIDKKPATFLVGEWKTLSKRIKTS